MKYCDILTEPFKGYQTIRDNGTTLRIHIKKSLQAPESERIWFCIDEGGQNYYSLLMSTEELRLITPLVDRVLK